MLFLSTRWDICVYPIWWKSSNIYLIWTKNTHYCIYWYTSMYATSMIYWLKLFWPAFNPEWNERSFWQMIHEPNSMLNLWIYVRKIITSSFQKQTYWTLTHLTSWILICCVLKVCIPYIPHFLVGVNTIQYNTIHNLYCAEYLTKLSLKGTLQA